MACSTLCIYGESGTGKSTSLRNLDPKTTFIISTTGKPLPFRAWKRNIFLLISIKIQRNFLETIT